MQQRSGDIGSAAQAPRPSRPELAWEPYLDAVRRYCRRRTISEVDAEDAAQDAVLRYLEHAGDEVSNPEAWLIQAASYSCTDIYRKQKRRRSEPVEVGADSLPEAPGYDPQVVVQSRLLLEQVFSRLQPKDRVVLGLLYLSDMSVQDVASRLKVTNGNARILALRARRRALGVLQTMEAGAAAVLGALGVKAAARWLLSGSKRAVRAVALRSTDATQVAAASSWTWQGAVASALPLLVVANGFGQAVASAHPAPLRGVASASAAAGEEADTAVATAPPTGTASPLTFAPSQVSHQGGAATTVPLLPLGATGTPQQDAGFSSTSMSPGYGNDGTVFASGRLVDGCAASCASVFVSKNRGVTWTRRASQGFAGGRILFPPSYPTDPTLFAVGPMGLQVSNDGAQSFTTVPLPTVDTAAVDPGSTPGHTRLLVGGTGLAVYDASTKVYSVGPALPAGVTGVTDVAYLGNSSSVVATGTQVDPLARSRQDGVVLLCDTKTCVVTAAYPDQLALHIAVSPAVVADHTVTVFSATSMWLSRNSAQTFSAVAVPTHADISTVVVGPQGANGRQDVIVGTIASPTDPGGVLMWSSDGAQTFAQVHAAGLPASIATILLLPDGRVLAGASLPDGAAAFGLRCSLDRGASWAPSC